MFNRLRKILVVDDSPDFRVLFGALLSRFKLDIHYAENGMEAIEFLRDNAVDLIVTDFRMPQVNGVQLLNWCRKNELFYPVIFTTADGVLFSTEEIALGDCCATLLRKPINPRILHAALCAADNFDHHSECMHGSLKEKQAEIEASLVQ
jgi:CheY-like chemotaxis protein